MSKNPPFPSTGSPPIPREGFETEVVHYLGLLIRDLPEGTAELRIGRIPNHQDWPEPYFEIIPQNPRAAAFKGFAVVTDLDVTIGEAARREFYGFGNGGTIFPGASWRDEFRSIWLAVTAGGFTERVYRDSEGRAIGSTTHLEVSGKKLVIREGQRSERLFGNTIADTIVYEPYFRT